MNLFRCLWKESRTRKKQNIYRQTHFTVKSVYAKKKFSKRRWKQKLFRMHLFGYVIVFSRLLWAPCFFLFSNIFHYCLFSFIIVVVVLVSKIKKKCLYWASFRVREKIYFIFGQNNISKQRKLWQKTMATKLYLISNISSINDDRAWVGTSVAYSIPLAIAQTIGQLKKV